MKSRIIKANERMILIADLLRSIERLPEVFTCGDLAEAPAIVHKLRMNNAATAEATRSRVRR